MTSEQRDPREAVLLSIQQQWFDAGKAEASPYYPSVRTDSLDRALARLDAGDPLRALLPEVVEGLEEAADCLSVQQVPGAVRALSRALAKLRTLHPATGGTDDGSA